MTVLHSLDLAPWNHGLRTEIDFVIIVPDTGILCLEVKSHENISFDGHRWHPETISRSPFKQALDGRHTFYRRLTELAPQFKRIPVVHCCIFPRSPFDLSPNLSVQPWDLIDSRVFRQFNSGDEFCKDLRVRMEKSIAAEEHLRRPDHSLSQHQIDSIVKYCLPVQRRRPEVREEIMRREERMTHLLRDQQKPVLQLTALNDRVVISGGAGTGKTLIAMDVARRAAERGSRVALLCYNQLIGDWMKQKIENSCPAIPNLVTGRAIRVMVGMTGLEIPDSPSRNYWETVLPQKLEDHLTDPDFKAAAAFDYLVLDEAQDVLARPWLWQCLSLFLAGGVERGAFALFGDFDNQVLSEREPMQRALSALYAHSRPVSWKLDENCRNYRIVGDTAVQLAGLSGQVYSGYLRSGGGVHNYDIFFYEDEHAQLTKLADWLKDFRVQGYKAYEITLLSFRADHLSAASRLQRTGYKLRQSWQAGDLTSYASVHAFKGMENKIVILTDVVLDDQDFHRHLFYTGMTRATESVRVLCNKGSQGILLGWLAGKVDI